MPAGQYFDTGSQTFKPLFDPSRVAGAQVAATAPAVRGVGDLWIDTDDDVRTWDMDWQYPPLLNGWLDYWAPQFGRCRYRKTIDGFVQVGGLVKAGTTGAPIFVLPVGYRPLVEIVWTGQTLSSSAGVAMSHMWIYRDGKFQINAYGTGGTSAWVTLNTTFYAAQ